MTTIYYGRKFETSGRRPRPYAEIALLESLKALRGVRRARVLELSSGCGWIGITVALELRGCGVVAVDPDPAVRSAAFRNARRHRASNYVVSPTAPGTGSFDVLIIEARDVEHFASLLRASLPSVSPGGAVIVSCPPSCASGISGVMEIAGVSGSRACPDPSGLSRALVGTVPA